MAKVEKRSFRQNVWIFIHFVSLIVMISYWGLLTGEFYGPYDYYPVLMIFIPVAIIVFASLIVILVGRRANLAAKQLHLWKILPGLFLVSTTIFPIPMKMFGSSHIPGNVPKEVFTWESSSSGSILGREFPRKGNEFPISYSVNKPTRVKIPIGEIESTRKYWSVNTVTAHAQGALNEDLMVELKASHEKPEDWGDKISGSKGSNTVVPKAKITLPISDEHHYQQIDLTIRADITYPYTFDYGKFANSDETLSRRLTFFVISPEDVHWRRTHMLNILPINLLMAGLVPGILLLIWGVLKIRKTILERYRKTSIMDKDPAGRIPAEANMAAHQTARTNDVKDAPAKAPVMDKDPVGRILAEANMTAGQIAQISGVKNTPAKAPIIAMIIQNLYEALLAFDKGVDVVGVPISPKEIGEGLERMLDDLRDQSKWAKLQEGLSAVDANRIVKLTGQIRAAANALLNSP